jgi:hypothetical protein
MGGGGSALNLIRPGSRRSVKAAVTKMNRPMSSSTAASQYNQSSILINKSMNKSNTNTNNYNFSQAVAANNSVIVHYGVDLI